MARHRYLSFLSIMLLGYAVFNRTFAYIGIPPLYIGEIALLWGGILCILSPVATMIAVANLPHLFLIGLMFWTFVCTVPYISLYGFDSIRDAMLVGYGAFSIIIVSLLLDSPKRLIWIYKIGYPKFIYAFLVGAFFVRCGVLLLGEENVPFIPGTHVPILGVRLGAFMMHLLGIAAYWMLGQQKVSWFWYGMMVLNLLFSFTNRGGLLAFVLGFSVVMVLRPTNAKIWRILALLCFIVGLLAVTGLELDLKHQGRKISVEQFVAQFASLGQSTGVADLDNTKEWRLNWWKDILNYTIYGPYLYQGKGFGINLAEDDGYSGTQFEGMRSPHNGHLTILARSGLVGFGLWILIQSTWLGAMALSYLNARLAKQDKWINLFVWIIAYWVAMMVNSSFDVHLEGPMGGIWFWVLFGFGLAASIIFIRCPAVMYSQFDEFQPSSDRHGTNPNICSRRSTDFRFYA